MNRITRRSLLATSAALAGGGALAACSDEITPAASSGPQGSGEGSKGGGNTADLSLWTFIDPTGTDARGMALKKVVDAFNAKGGPQVTVRSINYAQIDAEVIKATASNTGPDIVNIYSNQLPMHVAAEDIIALDELARSQLDDWGDDYIFPKATATFDGKLMSLPWEARAWLLWYRADLLEAAGLEPPTTLTELGVVAAKLKTGKVTTGLGIGYSDQGLGADFVEKFIPLTWGFKGEILDQDGKAVFASDAGVAAIKQLQDWKAAGAYGDEVLNLAADDVVNGVKASTIAMAIEGSFRVSAARAGDGIGDNLKTMAPPSDVAGTPLPTAVAGQTLAIGANAADPAAAWSFIQHYTSAESQLTFAQAKVLPVLSSVYDSGEFAAISGSDELKAWRDYVKSSGKSSPSTAKYNEMSAGLVKAGQQAVFKGVDPMKALTEAQTAFNAS